VFSMSYNQRPKTKVDDITIHHDRLTYLTVCKANIKKDNGLSDIPIACNLTWVTEEKRGKFTACILCSVERNISATAMLGAFLHSSLQFKVQVCVSEPL